MGSAIAIIIMSVVIYDCWCQWDFKFSWQLIWRRLSSWISHHMVWKKCTSKTLVNLYQTATSQKTGIFNVKLVLRCNSSNCYYTRPCHNSAYWIGARWGFWCGMNVLKDKWRGPGSQDPDWRHHHCQYGCPHVLETMACCSTQTGNCYVITTQSAGD